MIDSPQNQVSPSPNAASAGQKPLGAVGQCVLWMIAAGLVSIWFPLVAIAIALVGMVLTVKAATRGFGKVVAVLVTPLVLLGFGIRYRVATAEPTSQENVPHAPTSPASTIATPTAQAEAPAVLDAGATPPPVPLETISAAKLWRDFDENEAAANHRYTGKEFVVTGRVNKVTDGFPGTTVYISGPDGEARAGAGDFAEEDRERLFKLKPGQKIAVKCEVRGTTMADLILLQPCGFPPEPLTKDAETRKPKWYMHAVCRNASSSEWLPSSTSEPLRATSKAEATEKLCHQHCEVTGPYDPCMARCRQGRQFGDQCRFKVNRNPDNVEG